MYKPKPKAYDRNLSVGKLFEQAFYKVIKQQPNVSCVLATKEQDTKQGTDFVVDGIPVDVTFDFEEKDYVSFKKSYNRYWDMGIRTGNWHRTFEKPVVVIGLKATIKQKYILDYTIPNMARIIGDVSKMLDAMSDLYWEYEDAMNDC